MLIAAGAGAAVPFCAAQVLQDHTQQPAAAADHDTKIDAKPKKRGPRALAVVEFLPGGKARLVPVALWIDDRYYDASLYAANPEPMALEPETVYEATDYGEPTGLFTIQTAEQVKGNWVAMGRGSPTWRWTRSSPNKKPSSPSSNQKVTIVNSDRPVLKRAAATRRPHRRVAVEVPARRRAPVGPEQFFP